MRPNYVIIGNVTKDNLPQGAILGGTSSYAAVTAYKLEKQVGLVTRIGPDIPSLEILNGINLEAIQHTHSTTFENIYENGSRRQKLWDLSGPLAMEHVPDSWEQAPVIHLAPIAQEMSPAIIENFSNSLVGLTLQGWLRGRDQDCNVILQPHPALETWLPHVDVAVMSRADVFGDETLLTHYLTSVKVGVLTLGPEGCMVYHQGETIHVPVEPAAEVDPTGAGDIFSAAFLVAFYKSQDVVYSAQFANACASLSVGRVGVQGTPILSEVESHLNEMYKTGASHFTP